MALVPLFFAVIFALGTAAPEESTTVPPTAPSVVDWALTWEARDNTQAMQKKDAANQGNKRRTFIPSLLR